jgi:hypothetical protein
MHELAEAQSHARDGNLTIIPVLLDSRNEWKLEQLKPEHAAMLQSLLLRSAYIEYDHYDQAKSNKEIAKAIGSHNKIEFDPIVRKNIAGTELQLIQFRITASDGNLPTDILRHWSISIENDFLACTDGEEKPLENGLPIAFNGKGPGWLYAYLAIPFKNLSTVYIFNKPSNSYICVYDLGKPTKHLGNILPGD